MNTLNAALTAATLATLAALAQPSQAASISLSPSVQVLDVAVGTATFDLLMDFADNEATIGGGIDLDFSGPAVFAGFTPSVYFTGTADRAFTGFGTVYADNDLEIHFGHFNGLSGQNRLGTLAFTYSAPGTTTIALGINNRYGYFFSVASAQMDVGLTGATMNVTAAVPEPQTTALLLLGLGLVGALAQRRSALWRA